jgi:hypothetical protein
MAVIFGQRGAQNDRVYWMWKGSVKRRMRHKPLARSSWSKQAGLGV